LSGEDEPWTLSAGLWAYKGENPSTTPHKTSKKIRLI